MKIMMVSKLYLSQACLDSFMLPLVIFVVGFHLGRIHEKRWRSNVHRGINIESTKITYYCHRNRKKPLYSTLQADRSILEQVICLSFTWTTQLLMVVSVVSGRENGGHDVRCTDGFPSPNRVPPGPQISNSQLEKPWTSRLQLFPTDWFN